MTPARHGLPLPPRCRPVLRRWPLPGPRTGAPARSGRRGTLRCRRTSASRLGGAGFPRSGGWSARAAGCRGLPRRVPPTSNSAPGGTARSLRRLRSRSRRRCGGLAAGNRWPPRPGQRLAGPAQVARAMPSPYRWPPRGSVPANAGTDREPSALCVQQDSRHRRGCSRLHLAYPVADLTPMVIDRSM